MRTIKRLRRRGFYVVCKTWNHGPDIYLSHFPSLEEAVKFGEAEGQKLPVRGANDFQRQEWIEVHQPDTNRVISCGPAMEF